MNKLLLDGPKGKLLLCVLEPGNVKRLQQGEPIEFSLNAPELFPSGLPAKLSVGIAYSETPIADAKEIAKLVNPGGKFSDKRSAAIASSRPHCPECGSTIEQLGVWRSEQCPIWLVFCTQCGWTLASTPPIEGLEKKP